MSYAPNQILRWRQLHQLRSLLKNTSDEVALGRLSDDVGSPFLNTGILTCFPFNTGDNPPCGPIVPFSTFVRVLGSIHS
jgi:hypothetical protein